MTPNRSRTPRLRRRQGRLRSDRPSRPHPPAHVSGRDASTSATWSQWVVSRPSVKGGKRTLSEGLACARWLTCKGCWIDLAKLWGWHIPLRQGRELRQPSSRRAFRSRQFTSCLGFTGELDRKLSGSVVSQGVWRRVTPLPQRAGDWPLPMECSPPYGFFSRLSLCR